MKNTFNVFKISLLFVFGLFLIGCGEDTPVPGGGGGSGTGSTTDPTLTLTSDSEVSVDVGTSFVVGVTAKKGESPLQALYIYEGQTKLPNARFKIDGVQAAANPTLLLGADKTSFSKQITIVAPEAVGTQSYRIVVGDEASKTAEVTVSVTTKGGMPPTLTYSGSGNVQTSPGSKVGVKIAGTAGTSNLYSLLVKENDKVIDFNRLTILDIPALSNPIGLADEWVRSFEGRLVIQAPATPGVYNYELILEDKGGLTSSQTFKITTGTSVDQLTEYIVVHNASGPNKGGLDLDGETAGAANVGRDDAKADIVDLGINNSLPKATNWIRKVKGVNGTEVRFLVPGENGLSESFTFDGLVYKQQLIDAWSSARPLAENTTEYIEQGHMFAVKKGDKYYALNVIRVDATADNNEDKYVFDLKR